MAEVDGAIGFWSCDTPGSSTSATSRRSHLGGDDVTDDISFGNVGEWSCTRGYNGSKVCFGRAPVCYDPLLPPLCITYPTLTRKTTPYIDTSVRQHTSQSDRKTYRSIVMPCSQDIPDRSCCDSCRSTSIYSTQYHARTNPRLGSLARRRYLYRSRACTMLLEKRTAAH